MAESRELPVKSSVISFEAESNETVLKVGGSGSVMEKEASKEATSAPLSPSSVSGVLPSYPSVGSV